MIHFELSADADNYCVIGDPVTHSKSPQIHSMFAEQCGQRLHYQAITLASSEFEEGVLAMQQQGMKGLNVTLPHKGRACSWVQERSQRAEYAAAVNTIWFDEKGIAHGDNTDGAGLVDDLLANRIELGGKRLLILGAGGAVRGILQPCLCRRGYGFCQLGQGTWGTECSRRARDAGEAGGRIIFYLASAKTGGGAGTQRLKKKLALH